MAANVVTVAFDDANGMGSTASAANPIPSAGNIYNGASWEKLSRANSTSKLPSSAASTNPTSAKAAPGTVYAITATNTTAALKYLKLYNKASAPVAGTDIPTRTIALPPSNALTHIIFPTGLYFSTGIAWAMTGGASDGDGTLLASGDVVGVNIDYS